MALARRLVVLRALGLGDLLTAVPALRALADAFPHHQRVLAAPRALAPLVALIDGRDGSPALDRLVDSDELQPLAPELHGADVAVNLHGAGPQSHRLLLASRPRRALWFACPDVPQSHGAPGWRAAEHEVQRWCRLLGEHAITADPNDLDLRPPPGGAPAAAVGATLIHPGAASPARRWPAERFATVAAAERRCGRPVVVTGNSSEVGLCRIVADRAGLPSGSVLAGSTDMAGLCRAVAAAERVVCGDTGIAHLATALGTPSVVLFGPTSPREWGPPAARGRHRVLWVGETGDPHGSTPFPGLLRIGVDDVLDALDGLATDGGRREAA